MLKPSSVMMRRAARAGSSVGSTGAGCTCSFQLALLGPERDARAQAPRRTRSPGGGSPRAMISAVPFGSPEKARATKLAPEASAMTSGWNERMPVPPGESFVVPVGLGGRRRLALGHAVDVVVHHDVGQVDVAPAGVQEVVAADRVAVAVAAGDEHREIGPRDLESGGRRRARGRARRGSRSTSCRRGCATSSRCPTRPRPRAAAAAIVASALVSAPSTE